MSEAPTKDEFIRRLEAKDKVDEERLRPTLLAAKEKLEELTSREPLISEEDRGFKVDRLDLKSKFFQSGRFAFWGGLIKPQTFPALVEEKEYAGIIKNLRIPEPLRRRGLGGKIIEVWETTLSANGLSSFIITNINESALGFWKNLGYFIPEEEKSKPVPYYMAKRVT